MNKTLHSEWMDKNTIIQFFISSKYRLYRHLLMIVFIGLALFNSEPEYTEPTETFSQIIALLLFLLLVYTNMYLLVPRFLFKNKYALYSLSVLGIIAISGLIYIIGTYFYGSDVRLDPSKETVGILPFSFVILINISASAAIKLFQQWMLNMQLIYELGQAKTSAELEQCKRSYQKRSGKSISSFNEIK